MAAASEELQMQLIPVVEWDDDHVPWLVITGKDARNNPITTKGKASLYLNEATLARVMLTIPSAEEFADRRKRKRIAELELEIYNLRRSEMDYYR